MKLSTCNVVVNETGEEMEPNGPALFPILYFEEELSDSSIPWHWHEGFELIWITTGSLRVFVGEREHLLTAGQGIFINAGIFHSVQSPDHGNGRSRSLVFHPRLICSIDSIFWQNYIEPITQNKNLPMIFLDSSFLWKTEILTLAASVWERLYREDRWFELAVRNELSELLLVILKNFSVCEVKPDLKKLRNDSRMKTMLHYIHTNFSEEVLIADLASEALISESEVLRCFHTTLRTTPNQYLRQYRLQRAARMLTNTSLPILEISLNCGFQSSSYFSKSFREKMGCTPQNYRRKFS